MNFCQANGFNILAKENLNIAVKFRRKNKR